MSVLVVRRQEQGSIPGRHGRRHQNSAQSRPYPQPRTHEPTNPRTHEQCQWIVMLVVLVLLVGHGTERKNRVEPPQRPHCGFVVGTIWEKLRRRTVSLTLLFSLRSLRFRQVVEKTISRRSLVSFLLLRCGRLMVFDVNGRNEKKGHVKRRKIQNFARFHK